MQLETAIQLYFGNIDPVSIHTLTAASYNILRDISEIKEVTPMLVKDRMLEYVKDDKKKKFRNLVNKAKNFFKHANRDHSEQIEFSPIITEIMLFDACNQYSQLTSETPPILNIYCAWYIMKNPDTFNFPEKISEQIRDAAFDSSHMSKQEYFDFALSLKVQLPIR